jgi:3-deoxy-manno-octulosonate cytidylyltransferase (CMP-KDO synthetase)
LWGAPQLKIGIIIPARLESERLPGKVIKPFFDKPMIEHVWRRARLVNSKVETIITTDSNEIAAVCKSFNSKVIMTSSKHINGLSRVGEAAKSLNWDFFIILQADEILVEPRNLDRLIETIKKSKTHDFLNLITELTHHSELYDSNIVKCQVRENNSVINMFRKSGSIAPIENQMVFTKKICGVFAISKNALSKVVEAPTQRIEKSESIEQMKIIELNMDIIGVEIEMGYPSVNTEAEALKVIEILQTDKIQRTILEQFK